MAENLAKNLINLSDRGFSPDETAELRFNHGEGSLHIRPLVVVAQERFPIEIFTIIVDRHHWIASVIWRSECRRISDIRSFIYGESIGNRLRYSLNMWSSARIVASTTVAVTNSSILATIRYAVAIAVIVLIGFQTSVSYSSYRGSASGQAPCSRHLNYSIMLHYLLSQLLLWRDKCE